MGIVLDRSRVTKPPVTNENSKSDSIRLCRDEIFSLHLVWHLLLIEPNMDPYHLARIFATQKRVIVIPKVFLRLQDSRSDCQVRQFLIVSYAMAGQQTTYNIKIYLCL